MELPATFFAVSKNGFERIDIARSFIGPETDILQSFAARTPVVVPNLIAGTAIAVSTEVFSLARQLKTLSLHTMFAPITDVDEKVALVPTWAKESKGKGADMTFEWTAPEDMKLFVVSTWNLEGQAQFSQVRPINYLIPVSTITKRTYILPLPNIYDDGKICMGSAFATDTRKDAMSQFDHVVKAFQTTRWNTDLLRDLQKSIELFRFDPHGKQLPSVRPWVELATAVNHSHYQFLVKL